jgi:hypothetical protein
MKRTYIQIKTRQNLFRTVANTAWLYPESDIKTALANTTYSYEYTEDSIICPNLTSLIGVYTDIFNQTAISQPIGNPGFTLGVGTLLKDMGRELQFLLTNGELIVKWRLVQQLTPQTNIIPDPGNSPNETIGYITVFNSYGNVDGYNAGLDDVQIVRLG